MQPPENPNRQWCNRSRTTVEPTKSNKAGTVDMIAAQGAAKSRPERIGEASLRTITGIMLSGSPSEPLP